MNKKCFDLEKYRRKLALCKLAQNSTKPDIHVLAGFQLQPPNSIISQYNSKCIDHLWLQPFMLQVIQTMSKAR
jgi:hypothetical protein